jgi:uncharacterized pyridoxal phosphate-containing UPF0001 family protein
VQEVLIEVNIAGEVSKTGLPPLYLSRLLETAEDLSSVRIRGLMAIPPISRREGDNRRYFAQMHELFVDIQRKKYNNISMAELSMGMSGDFEDAVREGATLVRIGSAIFGTRHI